MPGHLHGRGQTRVNVTTPARLRPTEDPEKVQVLWWNGERWKDPGPFGRLTMPVDQAVEYIASEPAFWIHV
jgi:hypothetical protein